MADTLAQLHACEVRDVVARFRRAEKEYGTKKAEAARDKFFGWVEDNRGTEARQRLERDALALLNSQR